MKKIYFIFLSCLLFVLPATAQTIDEIQNKSDFKTTEEILALAHNQHQTNCADNIFSNALIQHSNEINESDPEYKVRAWAHEAMTGDVDILKELLNCPELQNIADETTIVFSPIHYEFPMGRTLTINYSTQPKVLKQKLMIAHKRSLPNGNASPDLMNIMDGSKYLNTEPAWYAIMVVQHNSLSEFVGPDKNNTLSMKYINDHIDEIYPHGYFCTSKSAIANDDDTINQVVKEVVKLDGDSNDYYVAGDVNLEWIMYAEIAADVIITVLTMGGGEVAMGALRSVRASKTGMALAKNMGKLKGLKHVAEYIKSADKIAFITKMEKNLKNAEKYEKALKNLEKARKASDAKDIAKYEKELNEIIDAAKQIDPKITEDILKDPRKLEQEIKDIKLYETNAKQFENIVKYRNELRALSRPQTGNIIVRAIKSIRAANGGTKTLAKAGRVARAGMSTRSAKIGHYLFDATLKHGARLAKFERNVGMLYGAISFLGDMYDRTSTTSKEFSNGIEFKPLCLLSADDLNGQENVVNYGMWLMWVGNSTDQSDDDAAYLQAMDFASKFYYQLDEFQDEHGANCNVDIYVVRPIIRLDETDIDNPSGELFYLFMNEIPWSTAEQFGENVKDVADWERAQTMLNEQDPKNKYHRTSE